MSGRKRKGSGLQSHEKRRRIRGSFHSSRRPKRGGYTYGTGTSGFTTRGQAKKAYSLKKYGGRPKISKKFLDTLYGDNSVVMTYLDRVATTNTTGQAANQALWSNRVTYDAAISSATQTYLAPYFNLVVHDPVVLNRYLTYTNTPAGNANAKTTKMFVKRYSVNATITNLENGPVEIWEYRMIARTRVGLGTLSGLYSTLNDPAATLATGGNLLQGGGYTAPTVTTTFPFATTVSTQLGITPYMIPGLTRYFKISSVKKKILNPADRWGIHYTCNKPMIYDNEKFNLATAPDATGSATTPVLWAGMGFSLFILKGTFGVDSAGATAQKIGIGNATVGIEYQVKFHYSLIHQNYMTTALVRDAPGFTVDESGYPAGVVRTVNLNAISTGPTPAAAGTNVWGPSGLAVEDDAMDDED